MKNELPEGAVKGARTAAGQTIAAEIGWCASGRNRTMGGNANKERLEQMAKSYYSIVLDHSADEVWAVIRRFDHYAWAGVEGETIIEDGKAGEQVGSVRRFTDKGNTVRQVLLAHSDVDRSYTYAFCGDPPIPVRDYEATIRVTPVTADNGSFIEWWATFDCAMEERDKWVKQLEQGGFAKWLAVLRQFMSNVGT
jgi:Polyketide cyclase / dehydrase and lipid transport